MADAMTDEQFDTERMISMKKLTSLFLALLIAGIVLTGCQGESQSSGQGAASQTDNESGTASPREDNSPEDTSPVDTSGDDTSSRDGSAIDTSSWTERDYHGVRFLLPEEWVGSANNVVFFATLPCGETATMSINLHGLQDEFSWDDPDDWEAVKVRLNEDASSEEGYQSIDCQEDQVCGQTGLIRHYKAVLSDSEFEVKSYSTVFNNTIVTFRTNILPERSDQASAELEQIITAAMDTADFSGLD